MNEFCQHVENKLQGIINVLINKKFEKSELENLNQNFEKNKLLYENESKNKDEVSFSKIRPQMFQNKLDQCD